VQEVHTGAMSKPQLSTELSGRGHQSSVATSEASSTDNDPDLRASSGSPVTHVSSLPVRPDITLFCELCHWQIDLHHLNEHRNYHKHLQVMKYRGSARPESLEKLMERRQSIIRNLKKSTESDLNTYELQKINEAYEFLKAHLEDTFEAYRRICKSRHEYLRGIGLSCSADSALAVGICSHGNDRWKNSMEDTRVFQDYFGNDAHKTFFALYDGHRGTFAADMASEELHRALLLEMSKFDPRTKCTCPANNSETVLGSMTPAPLDYCELHSRSPSTIIYEESTAMIKKIVEESSEKLIDAENLRSAHQMKRSKPKPVFWERMRAAFTKAHIYTDMLLVWGREEHSKVRWSGCSTLNVLIQDVLQGDDLPTSPSRGHEASSEGELETPRAGNEEELGSSKTQNDDEPELKQLGVIHLANAGNVRAVLVRGNRPYCITKDHTPNNAKERTRVIRQGGTVIKDKQPKVNGILHATRGLGNHGDPALRKCIIPEPYTHNVVIDQYAQFLILATNGLWEVFSNKEAASIVLQMIPSNHLSAPSQISTSIDRLLGNRIKSATDAHSVLTTDITAAAELPPEEMTSTPAAPCNLRPPSGTGGNLDRFLQASAVHGESSMVDLITEAGSEAEHTEAGSGDEDDDSLILEPRVTTRREMHRQLARAMSERLTQAALIAGARDNITVMVVLLPGCGV